MQINARRKKGLFILSKLLGGGIFVQNLIDCLNQMHDIEPIYLFLDTEAYQNSPAPKIVRSLDIFESAWVINEEFKKKKIGNFDFLFFQAIELTVPFRSIIKKYPAALAHDTTNILSSMLMYQQKPCLRTKLKKGISNITYTPIYKSIFANVDIFLPRTQWCANSLKKDYGVDEKRILVTYPPIDLARWRPPEKKIIRDKLMLCFVGNNFKRKGGDFLVELWQTYLKTTCLLTIVSNDKDVLPYKNLDGIKIMSGLTHNDETALISAYQDSDVFVFPTRNEKLGIALCEAASVGLPLIATDVGGIREVVQNGLNGYLMPYHAGKQQWAEKIMSLVNNPDILQCFGKNSRMLAEEQFDKKKFEEKIANIISELISKR